MRESRTFAHILLVCDVDRVTMVTAMRRLSVRIAPLLLAAACAAKTPTSLSAESENVVRLTFTRSGGFVAAPGMIVSATVDVDERRTRVTADQDRYTRDVPATEAAALRRIDPAQLTALESKQPPPTSAQADQYQYEITIEVAGGRKHTLTVSERAAAGDPGVAALLDWVRQECEKIWEHRIQSR